MKILGLVGSPRKAGNTEIAVKILSEELSGNLTLVRLSELRIESCTGCYRCILGKPCPIEDDMNTLLSLLPRFDFYILASPVYFLGANVSVKKVIDRAFMFFSILDKMWGRKGLTVTVSGVPGKEGTAELDLRYLAAFMGISTLGHVELHAALPGEVLNKENVEILRSAATKIKQGIPLEKRGCPICGNTVLAFRKGKIVCLFCESTLESDKGKLRVLEKGRSFLMSPEGLKEHKAWLMEKKMEFDRKRKEIARLVSPFREKG